MQKWEYMLLIQGWNEEERIFYWDDDRDDKRNQIERLNALGQEGWELASSHNLGTLVGGYAFILKRPVE